MARGKLLDSPGELYHERHGRADGPPVVLLHGLGSSSADWTWQVPVLAERYPVITVDLPAHGRSTLPAGPGLPAMSVEMMAKEVSALLGRLGEPPAHVVGLSLGGCVALALALTSPGRVRSLTLVNAFARLRPAGWRGAWRMLERMILLGVAPMSVIAARIAGNLFPGPEQGELRRAATESLGRNDKRAYVAAVRALARFDARPRLGEIECPTLIVAGERDRTVPRASAELLRRRIPAARLLVVPDSGHATPYDQPRVFNDLVVDFLSRVEAGREAR